MVTSILVADDHDVVRSGLVGLLSGQGDFRVVGTAAHGMDAVREAIRLRPDIAIIDIAMPGMNGIEATRELRDRLPETSVIIVSMHSSAEHVFHAFEAGARGFVTKTSAAREIVAAVRAVGVGRRYLSPLLARELPQPGTRPARESPLERLSRRERQVLQLVAEGCSSARIAGLLNLSPKSVDTYRSRTMDKLGLSDLASMVKFAIQHGVTTLETPGLPPPQPRMRCRSRSIPRLPIDPVPPANPTRTASSWSTTIPTCI